MCGDYLYVWQLPDWPQWPVWRYDLEALTDYSILERTQKGTLDVTEWLTWFLETLHRAVEEAHHTLDTVLAKARFWQRFAGKPMNARQV
jgi:Fic family protein